MFVQPWRRRHGSFFADQVLPAIPHSINLGEGTMQEETRGRISEVQKNKWIITFEGRELPAKPKGSFYYMPQETWPVVGDDVLFDSY